MALYTIPYSRLRRRMWERPYQDESWTEPECDVFVPVNVKAGAEEYVIIALLPGVKAEDLSIQVVNETVTIQGTIKDAGEGVEKENYLVRECPTGKFYRMIRLPEPLDSGKAEADLTDGLLTLRVPKTEEARPRTIKVTAK
jgi:HSP20 family protein